MRRFKLLNADGYSPSVFKVGGVYNEDFRALNLHAKVIDLAKVFPYAWEEVFEEKETQSASSITLTREQLDVLLDAVVNLGMTVRQDQLNGRERRSGSEILREFLDGKQL